LRIVNQLPETILTSNEDHLKALTRAGHLTQHGAGRGTR
jgi:hypothetical protein